MFSAPPELTASTRPWPADKVQRWPIHRLKRYANSPRLHSKADVGKIATSIQRFGWTMPPLVDEDGGVICGEARIDAAILLELTDIPVIVAKGWTEEERRAYRRTVAEKYAVPAAVKKSRRSQRVDEAAPRPERPPTHRAPQWPAD